ncbi:Tartrate transporter [Mycena kentingensis (nom. inval.)]|nr:Tartrate transporter [Mycena kentingensis (nom. inval.)]
MKSPDNEKHRASHERIEERRSVSCWSGLERKLVRKLDMRLLPTIILIVIVTYIDRNGITTARRKGLEADLGLTGPRYSVVLSVLFASQVPFQIPSDKILNYISRPSCDSEYDSDELLASSNNYTRCMKPGPDGDPHRRLLKLMRCWPEFHGFQCLKIEDHFDRQPHIEHIDPATMTLACSTCLKPNISDHCERLRCRKHCLALGGGCSYHQPKTTSYEAEYEWESEDVGEGEGEGEDLGYNGDQDADDEADEEMSEKEEMDEA